MKKLITCEICAREFAVIPSRAATAKHCGLRCHQIAAGRRGGEVSGELRKRLSRGLAYTKTKGRHTHRVVAEIKLGRALRPGETVHHIDGNRLNNAPDNIEVLPSQAHHLREHIAQMLAARKAKHGY